VAEAAVNRLEAVLRRLAADLDAIGARWSLLGGLAVSTRAAPRFTNDVDVAAVAATDDDAEQLVFALQARRYRVITTVEQERTSRLATARLLPPGEDEDGVFTDVLFASSGVEPEIVAAAESLAVLPGASFPVATAADLVALKVLSRDDAERPQDIADIRALAPKLTDADVARAGHLLDLVQQRGFHRGKDLAAELARALRDARR
jgi:hypothetical protein